MRILYRYRGFSLFELVAVLLIVAILSLVLLPRFVLPNTDVNRAKQNVLTSLRYARLTAMRLGNEEATVRLVLTPSTLDLQLNDRSITLPDIRYPLILPESVSLLSEYDALNFDKLGASTKTTLILSHGVHRYPVYLSAAGYAYE